MTYQLPWLLSSSDFSTSFPLTENPISQGGIWTRGLAEGLDWTNPKTTGGLACASVSPTPSRYSDDIAHLKTSYRAFNANQFAQGVAFVAGGYTGNGGAHEIELLLRFSISGHDAHGYEILFGIEGYITIVRWEGPVGTYTVLWDSGGGGSLAPPSNNEVLRAEISGNFITVKRGGVTVKTQDITAGGGTVWSTGQPGMGFWPVDGALTDSMGWKSWTAGNN